MTYGVTATGFNAKRTEDIKAEIQDDLRTTFGDGIDLSDEGPFGQIVAIYADRLGSIWSFMEQVYNSQYPSTAEGTSLDNVASITGSEREEPTYSRVTLTLYGDVGTTVDAGKTVSVVGNTDAKFDTDETVVIAAGVDNVQRLSFPTLPEAGQFTLNFNGEVTGSLNWNATAAQIEAALEALSGIGAGNVSVSGNVQDGTVDVTLENDLGSAPQNLLTVSANSLTSHEKTRIVTVADDSGDLDRTFFTIYDQAGSVGVWFDIDNSGSLPPAGALAADRQIEVTGASTDDSADSVAAALATALDADPEFGSGAVGNVNTTDDAAQGDRTDASDGDTGFTITTQNQGYSAGNLPIDITEQTAGVLPQASVTATAQDTGPVQAPAGTLTVIETPVTGWASVTNPLDADPVGTDLENDPTFRLRRLEEIAIAGRATTEAIKSKVLEVDDVTAVVVFENDTEIVDPEGRPPHCVDIVVQGGTVEDIAAAIFDVVAAGIQRIGDITENVLDSQGFTQPQRFSRPDDVDIYVELDLNINSEIYPDDGDDQVKAALVTYGDAIGIGADVIVHGTESVEWAISEIPGILDIVIRIDRAPAPTTDDNIEIEPREISAWDTSRIEVTTT